MRKFFILFLLGFYFTASAATIYPLSETFWQKVWRCKFNVSCYRTLGATITTIAATDLIKDSRAVINTNFSNLNAGKVENATSSMSSVTTLSNLVSIGTITTGTWNASILTVSYGGTGSSTLSSNHILVGNGTGNIGVINGFGTSGQFLTSNGEATLPTWQSATVNQTLNYTWTGQHIFNTQNVGIATATPATNFSVQGNALISGTTTSGNLVATSTLAVGNSRVSSLSKLIYSSVNAAPAVVVNASTTLLFTKIPANTLSTNNSINFTFYIRNFTKPDSDNVIIDMAYGNATTTINLAPVNTGSLEIGTLEILLTADNATNAQSLSGLFNVYAPGISATLLEGTRAATSTAMAIDSTKEQMLNVVISFTGGTGGTFTTNQIIGYVLGR